MSRRRRRVRARNERTPREPINWADLVEIAVGIGFLGLGLALILTRT